MKKKIYVKFSGGLGNQMFQYAFLSMLERKYPSYEIKAEVSYYLKKIFSTIELEEVLGIELKKQTLFEALKYGDFLTKVCFILFSKQLFQKRKNRILERDYTNAKIKNHSLLSGYWQSEDFFKEYEEVIRQKMSLPSPQDEKSKEYLKEIEKSFSVSVHVRRGDYLSGNNPSYFVNLSETQYYKNAIDYIRGNYTNCKFFVFSDDIDWCKKNFTGEDFLFVDGNSTKDAWKDIYLMCQCKANIVANSSFSWWGAYLGQKDIVLAPSYLGTEFEKSHPNYYPENWMKIEC